MPHLTSQPWRRFISSSCGVAGSLVAGFDFDAGLAFVDFSDLSVFVVDFWRLLLGGGSMSITEERSLSDKSASLEGAGGMGAGFALVEGLVVGFLISSSLSALPALFTSLSGGVDRSSSSSSSISDSEDGVIFRRFLTGALLSVDFRFVAGFSFSTFFALAAGADFAGGARFLGAMGLDEGCDDFES